MSCDFADSGTGLASEDKKLLLERYGYDANDDFASQSKVFFGFFHNCFDLVSDKLFRVETLVLIVESEKERRENEWKE